MLRDSAGFTLVEFLVAIVILMVGLLGILQVINVALIRNLETQLRNEAVTVADQAMSIEMAKGFDAVSTSQKNTFVRRQILNSFINFSTIRTGTTLSTSNSKQVSFEVRWKFKNTQYSHQLYGGISKTNQ